MSLTHLPATATADEVAQSLRANGYAIVDELAPVALMQQIGEEMAAYVEESPWGRDAYLGKLTRRSGSLVARSPASRELVMHPLVLDVVGKFLSKAASFQLQLTQIISVYPGSPAQKLHQDQTIWDFFPFPDDYEPQCNLLWALSDYTAENGATRIVPDSQYERVKDYVESDSLPAVMKPGSALFYSGKIYHGAGHNQSEGVRQAVNITYAAGWLRQEENQYLSCPIEIARTLPEDLLRLMGYDMGCLGMGYIRDFEHPMVAIREPAVREALSIDLLKKASNRNADIGTFLNDIAG